MNIKITPAICKEIRQHARDYIGGFGMWLELGERVQGDRMYFNCLTPGDDMDGDLYDHLPWSGVRNLEVPAIDGRVLLDFYVHDSEELRSNLIVGIDADGIGEVYECSHTFDRLRYKREGYAVTAKE